MVDGSSRTTSRVGRPGGQASRDADDLCLTENLIDMPDADNPFTPGEAPPNPDRSARSLARAAKYGYFATVFFVIGGIAFGAWWGTGIIPWLMLNVVAPLGVVLAVVLRVLSIIYGRRAKQSEVGRKSFAAKFADYDRTWEDREGEV